MKVLTPCKMCKRVKWFSVPRRRDNPNRRDYPKKDNLEDLKFYFCQPCRNLIARMKQREARMGYVARDTKEYIRRAKEAAKRVG